MRLNTFALIFCVLLASSAFAKPSLHQKLQSQLEKIKTQFSGQIGIQISDPHLGTVASIDSDRTWYLASTTKVFVASEVIRQIEKGQLSYDEKITLKASDYRDGAGQTNYHKPGARLSIRYLLEQMLYESDNAATDLLINRVGTHQLNATISSEISEGIGPITSLLDVRRLAYGEIHPSAHRLEPIGFISLKKSGKDSVTKLNLFSKLTGVPFSQFRFKSVSAAYESYYSKGYNSGTLTAYTKLLSRLAKREWISPFVSNELFKFMSSCLTGKDRIKAGLPSGYAFAHKTGTQLSRICDMGVIQTPSKKTLTVAVCAQGFQNDKQAALAFQKVGAALASVY